MADLDLHGEYLELLKRLGDGRRERAPQFEMIRHIADAARRGAPLVVEAETGVGKTLGYTFPVLRQLREDDERILVISTSTVVLQNQLRTEVERILDAMDLGDLPVALGKGRERYVCMQSLDRLALSRGLTENFEKAADTPAALTYTQLHEAVAAGHWDGDLDSPPEGAYLPGDSGPRLSSTSLECPMRNCSTRSKPACPLRRSRKDLQEARVIIVNHDFLISHWFELGGSSVLPEPHRCALVIDEAHSLAEKICSHSSIGLSVRQVQDALEQLPKILQGLMGGDVITREHVERAQQYEKQVSQWMLPVVAWLQGLGADQQVFPDEEMGESREVFAELLLQLKRSKLLGWLQLKVIDKLRDERTDDPGERGQDDTLISLVRCEEVIGGLHSLAAGFAELTRQARSVSELSAGGASERGINCIPMTVPEAIREQIWSQLQFGPVLTSATLKSSDGFQSLVEGLHLQDDINPETDLCTFGGVFDHAAAATLEIVPMQVRAPTGRKADYMAELFQLLPGYLAGEGGRLMICNSREDLEQISAYLQGLPEWRDAVLVQNQETLDVLLRQHVERVRDGAPSVLCGLRSLAEGLDLPGDQCTRILVIRLPFESPAEPVNQCWEAHYKHHPDYDEERREWGNWSERQIPMAALRFKQICGRLLRTESDRGDICVFDMRLSDKGYGQKMLGILPPYSLKQPRRK
ncbi:MAG: DEAD/DEAH box helicase [Gammaproteobacteria bacterium AqS3]|nr:DEAD/DEAH box helicase [Gammaproteobacteria bacterium AqS3]